MSDPQIQSGTGTPVLTGHSTALAAIAAFIDARLAEDEAAVKGNLCIHCGGHTVPLASAFGITGYTHDGRMSNGRWEHGWQGVRCQNRLTGAEPVQAPARVLAAVASTRDLVARIQATRHADSCWSACRGHASDCDCGRDDLARQLLAAAAARWAWHPEHGKAWGTAAGDLRQSS